MALKHAFRKRIYDLGDPASTPHDYVIKAYRRMAVGSDFSSILRANHMCPGMLFGKRYVKKYGRGLLLSSYTSHIRAHKDQLGDSFTNTLFKLEVQEDHQGTISSHWVVPAEVQVSTVGTPMHCSFLGYDPDRGLKLDIPINYINAELCQTLERGGQLNYQFQYLKCHVKGERIPHEFVVDLAGRPADFRITLANANIPKEFRVILPPHLQGKHPTEVTLARIKGDHDELKIGGEDEMERRAIMTGNFAEYDAHLDALEAEEEDEEDDEE